MIKIAKDDELIYLTESTRQSNILSLRLTTTKPNKLCNIKLNYGIKRINLVAFYILIFFTTVVTNIVNSFVTFILEDSEYYNLTKDEVALNMGRIGMISEVFVIVLQIFMGILVDIFGRKWPLVIGFAIAGIAVGVIPLFTELYPWYLIIRILIGTGIVIGTNIPLIPDYV